MMGIYQIRNVLNDKIYVGSTSVSINGRWQQHKSLYKTGKYTQKCLSILFNVSESAVWNVVNNKRWVEVEK